MNNLDFSQDHSSGGFNNCESCPFSVCNCNYYPPNIKSIIRPSFLKKLARHHTKKGTPMLRNAIAAWAELDEHHTGQLFAYPEGARPGKCDLMQAQPFVMDAVFKDGEEPFEWCFGKDWARSMSRFLDRADRSFSNRMKCSDRLLMRVLILDYSRRVNECRTKGHCSKIKADQT